MRIVKVVAGVFGILALGALGVIADGETYAPGVSDNMLHELRTPVTAAASIETTTTAPQEKHTAAVSYETLAAAETASSLLTTSQMTASAAESTAAVMSVTTVTTVETAASAETEAEPEPEPDAVSEACSEEETEECADSDDSEEPEETEESEESEETEEASEESEEEAESEAEPDETEPAEESENEASEEKASSAITVTEEEYIMICNVVGHEYGANWISEYDKALVVEVIMNRVFSSKFPNTVYEVLMQKGQFPGLSRLIHLGRFSKQVTPSVKAAVDLYLSHPEKFQHGYLFYSGDGHRNYFRTRA